MRSLLLALLLIPALSAAFPDWKSLEPADRTAWENGVMSTLERGGSPAEDYAITRLLALRQGDEDTFWTIYFDQWYRLRLAATLAGAKMRKQFGEPTEEQLAAFAQSRRDAYDQPNQIDLDSIQVRVLDETDEGEARATALKARAELDAGISFAEVALRYSDSSSRAFSGTVGTVVPGKLSPAVDAVIWKLADNETTGPLRLDRGYYIFRARNRRPPFSLSNPQIRSRVISDWLGLQIGPAYEDMVAGFKSANQIEERLAAAGALDDVWLRGAKGIMVPRGVVWIGASRQNLEVSLTAAEQFSFVDEAPFQRDPLIYGMAAIQDGIANDETFKRALELGAMARKADWWLRSWYQHIAPTDEELATLLEESRRTEFTPIPVYTASVIRWPLPEADAPHDRQAFAALMETRLRTMRDTLHRQVHSTPEAVLQGVVSELEGSTITEYNAVESVGPYVDASLFRTPAGQFSKPFDERGTVCILYMKERSEKHATVENIRETLVSRWKDKALKKLVEAARAEIAASEKDE